MPDSTPEDIKFEQYLHTLTAIQFQGMNEVDRQNLSETLEEIRTEYVNARAKADDKELTEVQKEKFKEVADAIANGLPGITKGALAAAQAFQNGDNMSGAAAIMDICASVVPIFGSLAGPVGAGAGAIIGAIFSCVGQILAFFAPKQPSLEEKIQKMLDHSQSEEQIRLLAGVGHGINIYANDLKRKCMGVHKFEQNVLAGTVALTSNSKTVTGAGTNFKTLAARQWLAFDSDSSKKLYQIAEIVSDTSLKLESAYSGAATAATPVKQFVRTVIRRGVDEILAMPLETEEQADAFAEEVTALMMGLLLNLEKVNIGAFNLWTVAGYLERGDNQKKEGWPEVLGTWCQTYADLLNANIMLNCLANPKKIQEQRAKVEPGKSVLTESTRVRCHDLLIDLKALADVLSDAWKSDGTEAQKVLNAVTPAARNRGLYLHKGYWDAGKGYILYVAVGQPNGKDSLSWDYKKNTGWLKGPRGGSFSIIVPEEQRGSLTPQYALFLFEDNSRRITRYSLDSITGGLSGGPTLLQDGTQYPNWGGNDTRRFESCVDACVLVDPAPATPANPPKGIRIYTAHDEGTVCYVNIHTVGPDNKVWRLNWEPATSNGLSDIRALYRPPTTLLDDPDRAAMPPGLYDIIYGGYSDNPKIWIALQNSWAEVPSPWTDPYNGIEVDQNYLWVFGRHGLACATHASVIRCKKGEIPKPNWITYSTNWPDGFNVRSLCPSADGILTISSQQRDMNVWTPNYEIKLKEPRKIRAGISIRRGGDASQIRKMPIPCWSMLESLKANLQSH